jgi:simple sugar transport system permease protein
MLDRILSASFVVMTLTAAVRTASPILLAAIGEIFSERSGVLNVGLEGQMLMGALFGFLGTYFVGSHWVGIVVGMLAGAAIALIVAVMSVSLFADQVVTGVTINVLCLGITTYVYKTAFGVSMSMPTVETLPTVRLPLLSDIPYLGPILFQHRTFVYATAAIALATAWVLYRTTIGLHIRAVGEHPLAAETMGVDVKRTRYACVVLSGILAGLGGALLSVGDVGYFTLNMSAGRGFMALAIVVFSGWDPLSAIVTSLLFSAADSLQWSLQAVGVGIPPQLMSALPYLLPIVALAVARTRSQAPAALAQPFAKEG